MSGSVTSSTSWGACTDDRAGSDAWEECTVDPRHLDALAKRLSTLGSRRTALGGVLAGFLLPLEVAARGKGKGKGKGRNAKDRSMRPSVTPRASM